MVLYLYYIPRGDNDECETLAARRSLKFCMFCVVENKLDQEITNGEFVFFHFCLFLYSIYIKLSILTYCILYYQIVTKGSLLLLNLP